MRNIFCHLNDVNIIDHNKFKTKARSELWKNLSPSISVLPCLVSTNCRKGFIQICCGYVIKITPKKKINAATNDLTNYCYKTEVIATTLTDIYILNLLHT